MLTEEQSKIVSIVYRELIESESENYWSNTDTQLELLEYLDDDQLHREADLLFCSHQHKKIGCEVNPDQNPHKCFMADLFEAVGYILELYKETGFLHQNNKYILQCYLAFYQTGELMAY